ncbi:hypothetical protein IJS77_05275 [bacterium]|nr:hypothetical protein [bacterium]
MRIKELHELLQKNKNGKVTQNDIARAIGTSRANVSKLFAKNSFINDDKLEKIEEYFDINIKKIQSGLIEVDYYPDIFATFEKGKVKISEKCVKCFIPSAIFPFKENAEYFMSHSIDDSMSPVIMNGDFIIIEKSCKEELINNKIYAFMYNGNIYIKRLTKNINQIVVFSENKDYPTQYISNEDMKKFCLFGKVVYIGRSFGSL